MRKYWVITISVLCLFPFLIKSQTCNVSFSYSVNNNVVTFSNTSVFPATLAPLFYWNLGNGNTFTTTSLSQTLSMTYTNNGLFAASITGPNLVLPGCTDNFQDTFQVSIPGCPLHSNVLVNYGVYSSPAVNFSANTVGTSSNTTFLWDFDDGTTSILSNPTHTYSGNGRYDFSLTVSNSPTCSAIYFVQSWIVPRIHEYDGITICSYNSAISFTQGAQGSTSLSLSGIGNYVNVGWTFGDGANGFGPNIVHTYFNGSYTPSVSCIIWSNCMPTTTTNAVINISNNPCIVNSAFGYTANSPGSLVFVPSSVPNSTSTVFLWYFGDGTSSNSYSPTHTYASSGTFSIEHTTYESANFAGCNQTSTTNVLVTGIPCIANSGFTASSIGPQSMLIVPSYPYNLSSVLWDWGDGSTSNVLYTTHTYSASGTYSICLTVTASCASTSSTCVNQFVAKQQTNSDFVTVTVVPPSTVTQIKETVTDQVSFSVFPNPNKGDFILGLENGFIPEKVTVYDLYGRIIQFDSKAEQNGQTRILLINPTESLYIIEININGRIFRKKLMVNH